MFKFAVTMNDGKVVEVEAGQWVDAGHEGRWIDFKTQAGTTWYPVLRLKAQDVAKIERKD
jgi:hypothetical protein